MKRFLVVLVVLYMAMGLSASAETPTESPPPVVEEELDSTQEKSSDSEEPVNPVEVEVSKKPCYSEFDLLPQGEGLYFYPEVVTYPYPSPTSLWYELGGGAERHRSIRRLRAHPYLFARRLCFLPIRTFSV
jgi:hypothetical protein